MAELKETYDKGDGKAEDVKKEIARFTSVEKEEIEDKKQQLNEFYRKLHLRNCLWIIWRKPYQTS